MLEDGESSMRMESEGGDLPASDLQADGRRADNTDLQTAEGSSADQHEAADEDLHAYDHGDEDGSSIEPFFFSSQRSFMTVLQKTIFGKAVPAATSSWWIDMALRRAQDSFLRAHAQIFEADLLLQEWRKVLAASILEIMGFCFYQEATKRSWVHDLPYRQCWSYPPIDVFKTVNLPSILLDDCRSSMGALLQPLRVCHANLLLVNLEVRASSTMADYHLRNSLIGYISDLEGLMKEKAIFDDFFPGVSQQEFDLLSRRIKDLRDNGHLDY